MSTSPPEDNKKSTQVEENSENVPIEEEDEYNSDDDLSGLDINDLDEGYDLGALLTSDEGDTIPSVLENIGEVLSGIEGQMKITNKILVKLLTKLG